MEEKLNNIDERVGKNVSDTTNYLKKLSDYVEKKLYDKDGNLKEGGVQSLSLTFAMFVGFSMAILVVSIVVISFIIVTKNNTIEEKEESLNKTTLKLEKSETEKDSWQSRYSNVYSQCDSIGYERAKKALEFSRNLNNDFETQKTKIKTQIKDKDNEINTWKSVNDKIKSAME